MPVRSRKPVGPLDTAHTFSARWIVGFFASAAMGRRRSLARDGLRDMAKWRPPPRVVGDEHIPADGPFIVAMNHYERPGLRVWWAGILVAAAILRRRGEEPAVRWLTADRLYRFRIGPIRAPDALVRWLLALIAYEYSFIPVHRERAGFRVGALREARAVLRGRGRAPPRPIGVTPEGATGGGRVLGAPWPASGIALAWLSRGSVPVLPVGVFEDDAGRMTARFGRPFTMAWPGLRQARRDQAALAAQAMREIAVLVPAGLRREYAE